MGQQEIMDYLKKEKRWVLVKELRRQPFANSMIDQHLLSLCSCCLIDVKKIGVDRWVRKRKR